MDGIFIPNETINGLILENDGLRNDHNLSTKIVPMVLVSIISSLTIATNNVTWHSQDSTFSDPGTMFTNHESNESFFNSSIMQVRDKIEGDEHMSIDDKEFGSLQQQVKDQVQTLSEIQNSLSSINQSISEIKIQTANPISKDDIKELITASINEARLNTIKWICGTAIAVAAVVIAAIKLF